MSVKRTRIIYGLVIIAVLIIPLVFLNAGFFNTASEKVLPGVKVLGTDLEGLNRAEGTTRLAELEKNLRATRVTLNYEERSWPLLLNEAGLDLDEEAVMDAALLAGRNGSLVRQWQERKQFKQSGKVIPPVVHFDRERLSQRVKELTREVAIEPVDANFAIDENERVSVLPGKNGTDVDIEQLENDLRSVVVEGKRNNVELTMVTVLPARSTAMVEAMGIDGLLAGYYTWFDSGKVSRTYNIKVAARAFDGQLIRPEHEVSFNKVVGPRSSEAGYKNAPVIINNEFVDGLGGGVCQVSTTLYNCVLLAGLEIVERSNHSLPVSYVPIGRDATVVYDALDLKFRNNTGSYIYIKTFVSGGQLGFKIYGNTAYKQDVRVNSWVTREIEPAVIYENDPNLLKGEQVVKQEGAKGFYVAAERLFYAQGVVQKREVLTSSDYSPVPKIIAVGTMEQTAPRIAPSIPPPPAGWSGQTNTGRGDTSQPAGGLNSGSAPISRVIPAAAPTAD